jgi:DNA-binding phage protein
VYQYFLGIDTLELMVEIDAVKRRFERLLPAVDERMRRLIAAAESLAIGYGGISIVSRATGVSRRAIARGIVDLGKPRCLPAELSANPAEDASAQWNRTRRL